MANTDDDGKTFMVEGGRIIFRNFAGEEGQYNHKGDRNFALVLTPEMAATLDAGGWNVKVLASREEGDPDTPYIPVAVSYKGRPPRVVIMTDRVRTPLSEADIEMLDWANIDYVDVICRAYDWTANGKSGRKAYLQTLFVKVLEDALEAKYSINEVPSHSGD